MKMGLLGIASLIFVSGSAYANNERVWEHVLFDGIDPFTPWQTKIDWVPSSIFGVPAPRTQCKKMQSKIVIYIEVPKNALDYVKRKAQVCGQNALKDGVLAGLANALLTNGVGAFDTFLATTGASFNMCVINAGPGIALKYENPTGWTEWGAC